MKKNSSNKTVKTKNTYKNKAPPTEIIQSVHLAYVEEPPHFVPCTHAVNLVIIDEDSDGATLAYSVYTEEDECDFGYNLFGDTDASSIDEEVPLDLINDVFNVAHDETMSNVARMPDAASVNDETDESIDLSMIHTVPPRNLKDDSLCDATDPQEYSSDDISDVTPCPPVTEEECIRSDRAIRAFLQQIQERYGCLVRHDMEKYYKYHFDGETGLYYCTHPNGVYHFPECRPRPPELGDFPCNYRFDHEAFVAEASGALSQQLCGIPPVHRQEQGVNPLNFWLPDSGATTHMTPFLSDIDPDTFVPAETRVRTANNEITWACGSGTVTITIRDEITHETFSWKLYNVLVVPALAKRLLSTNELNKLNHEIRFKRDVISFLLSIPGRSKIMINIPKRYLQDSQTGALSWPSEGATQSRHGKTQFVMASTMDITAEVALETAPESLEEIHYAANELPNENRMPKRQVGTDLMHHRLGHRSYEALLLANKHNIWNDVRLQRDPEGICETCRITLSRRANRNHQRPPDYPTLPGRMVMTDIISNPFPKGLTVKSHFSYYLLIVDVVSHLPVLIGLPRIDSVTVFRALQRYRTHFQPNPDLDANPEVNISPFCHVRADAGTQFSSQQFLDRCDRANMKVTIAAPKHQEMNGLCERTWQSLRQLAFSMMNYGRVSEDFGDMALEHAWKVFACLPLKQLSDGDHLTTPFEKHYNRKPSLRKFRVLFCPCVYKVYTREKTTTTKLDSSKKLRVTQRFNASNHPQRGAVGIFVGHPRGHAGYLIWDPRTKKLRVSGDVTFDETFDSAGPRRHYAFSDALPTILPDAVPTQRIFMNTIPEDDHYGPPLLEFHEDLPTDGYLAISTAPVNEEIYDSDVDDIPTPTDHPTPSDMSSNPEHLFMEEENESAEPAKSSTPPSHKSFDNNPTPLDDDPIIDPLDDDPMIDIPPSELIPEHKDEVDEIKIDTTSDERPLVIDDELFHDKPIMERPKRTIKKRKIWDPTDFAMQVETVFDDFNVPIEDITLETTENIGAVVPDPDSVEGAEAALFLPEPQSLKAVLRLPPKIRDAWIKAYRAEFVNMIITKKTFSHPKDYKGEPCLPIRIVHKTKLKSDGTVDKVKVRAAIRGDLDKSGPKDEDNSAPLATFRTLKIFLAEAARRCRRVFHSDYVGAYLQAYMDRIIYVILPTELAELFPDLAEWFGVPLLLEKSAYGINAAGRLWAEELFGWYIEYGFVQSTVDPSMFYYNIDDDWIVLLNYCDDTAYFTSTTEVRKKFETAMCKRFDCKLLGQIHWFLQARVTQHENYDITIDQSRYAASMCTRFLPNHEVVKPSSSDCAKYLAPLPANFVFTTKDCTDDHTEYRKLVKEFGFEYPVVIGCLLWILNTYPRLQFAIRKLAKFTQRPGKQHFRAILHLLHHVRCHHNVGLKYYSDAMDAPVSQLLFEQGIDPAEHPFYVFADSSWQDCPDTARSTGGYHIFMQGGIVDSAMTFPTPVALSSAEAEYNNASVATAAVASMSMITQDLKQLDTDKPLHIPILIDNKACISMGENFRDSKHTRHILRRYHYVRYMLNESFISLQWIPAEVQLADPVTKCLTGTSPSLILFRALGESQVIP